MNGALSNLLQGGIDYAGLFPPANLTLDQAVEVFTADRASEYQDWLRHFVLPAKRMHEFDSLRNALPNDTQWTLSLLMGGGDTLQDWQASVEDALKIFEGDRGDAADPVRALEIALPQAMAADTASFTQAIESINHHIAHTSLDGSDLFFETTSPGHRQILAEILCERQKREVNIGLKLRTGGLTSSHFPSIEQLADCIRLCHSRNIPWKATAGLHHPLPHDCPQTGATMHGFLNLILAVVFLEGDLLAGENLEDLLSDRDAEHFTFTDTNLDWKGITADLGQIRAGRERFISFGSCSFAEPIEDLTGLGFLTV